VSSQCGCCCCRDSGPFITNSTPRNPPTKPARTHENDSAYAQQQVATDGGQLQVDTVGASENYHRFIEGYLEWIDTVTPPYPPIPPGSGNMPPLDERYRADVEWVRALTRGAFPSVVKGRPKHITPAATDPLQNGEVSSLAPGPAWVSKLSKATLRDVRRRVAVEGSG